MTIVTKCWVLSRDKQNDIDSQEAKRKKEKQNKTKETSFDYNAAKIFLRRVPKIQDQNVIIFHDLFFFQDFWNLF